MPTAAEKCSQFSIKNIEKLSIGLDITVDALKERHLVMDSESEEYTFNKKPCPFLRDNLCLCYSSRPEACASYPYLNKPDFIFRLINVIGNYSICPIVFNVYERLKVSKWLKKPLRENKLIGSEEGF